jgi:two-component system chemotaxis response regulator CheB
MVCDDSAVIRGAVARMLEADSGLQVVGRVANGQSAVDELKRTPADVLVLDIEMPVMDGMTALPLLLRADPGLKVIMASTLTTRGADIALRALKLGAADYVPKPSAVTGDEAFRRELVEKVKGLGRMRRRSAQPVREATALRLRPAALAPPRLLAVGSSTGGPQALFTLVQGLGRTLNVPVVMTQHMPPTFTAILADHIAKLGGMPCAEAKDGEALTAGRIYLAPGDRHLVVVSGRGGLQARLNSDPPENFCRPSVDPMLRSAAAACDGRVLVAMLTGMGQDGLAGTRRVIDAGGPRWRRTKPPAWSGACQVRWRRPGCATRFCRCRG